MITKFADLQSYSADIDNGWSSCVFIFSYCLCRKSLEANGRESRDGEINYDMIEIGRGVVIVHGSAL